MLTDSVTIRIVAGKGGDGIVSWRHEKHIPRGGPDGGDGGNGGNVYMESTHNLDTLSSFKYRKMFMAGDGQRGMSKKCYGAKGDSLELLVPTGTLLKNPENGQILFDFDTNGKKYLVAKGGWGGKGNVHFKTATNRNPFECSLGSLGESKDLILELRYVADVGLVGLPNAGKSTLINHLTGTEGRIAPFPFSTIDPMLGVLRLGKERLILIDLPGLIEGAHQGRGLGIKFLKHLARVKYIINIAEATSTDIKKDIEVIEKEMESFDKDLLKKPRILVINKVDLLSKDEFKDLKKEYPKAVFISAKEGDNTKELIQKLSKLTK